MAGFAECPNSDGLCVPAWPHGLPWWAECRRKRRRAVCRDVAHPEAHPAAESNAPVAQLQSEQSGFFWPLAAVTARIYYDESGTTMCSVCSAVMADSVGAGWRRRAVNARAPHARSKRGTLGLLSMHRRSSPSCDATTCRRAWAASTIALAQGLAAHFLPRCTTLSISYKRT